MNDGSSIVSYDLFMEAVSENYDPNIYSKGEYWKSLDQAITSTKKDIDSKKDFLSEHDDTIEQFKLGEISGDQTVDDMELSRAMEIKSKFFGILTTPFWKKRLHVVPFGDRSNFF